ncbi:hypothetical protein RND71_003784 [Anisodus tanguticus]|uniref:SGNH hydrolase-type esterase domain-containing protein n=1 Tax=Anisodus tanguticus TaxID=243964 RepID=A0AAE1STX7_9SOLA|nr:hypothetical protein RND71_003784 [Anisodus tanguticus]
MVGPSRPQIVLFGSSIVQFSYNHEGWGAILTDLYACKADIVLRGYGGWNSRIALQVLDQIFPKDAAVQPSLVIVYFGGNDSVRPDPNDLSSSHVPLPEYIQNMKKIVLHLKSLSEKTRIVILSTPAVNEEQIIKVYGNSRRSNESSQKYSEACIQMCQELGIKVIDLWTALQNRDDWLTAHFTDGVHLSAEGSKVVVKEILKVVKEAEWEPNLHWRSLPTEFAKYSPCIFLGPDSKTAVNVGDMDFDWQTQWI